MTTLPSSIATRFLLTLLVGLFSLVWFAGTADAETRRLKMYYTHTKESINVVFKKNGRYNRSGLKKLNRFLRDFRRNEPTKMDPELFDLVWEVYRASGSRKPIHVISGYRSPRTNNMLRKRGRKVARNSQHTQGKALDFFMPDVSVNKLRALGLKAHRGGVGYYSGSFVHLDTGRVRHWPRMSRRQLAKVFPRGKTIHVPSNGKPLKGYKTAMANLKKGRNADGSRRGSRVRKSLLASLFSRSGNDGDEGEARDTKVAPKPVRAKREKKPAPKPVAVAKAEVKLPRAKKGPNVFAAEANAAAKQKTAAEAAARLAEAKLKADDARTAELAAAAEKSIREADAANVEALAARATQAPERLTVPRRRPAAPAPTVLAALAPVPNAQNEPLAPISATDLALAKPALTARPDGPRPPADIPGGDAAAPKQVIADDTPKPPASIPNAATIPAQKPKVLKKVIEIASLTPAGRDDAIRTDGGTGSGINALNDSVNSTLNASATARAAAEKLKQDEVARANSALAAALAKVPTPRPNDEGATLQVAALAPAPTSMPNWRASDAAGNGAGTGDAVTETVAEVPVPDEKGLTEFNGTARMKAHLALGNLDGRAVKVWAVASSTRVGAIARLRAPDYRQGPRRISPASVYSAGFDGSSAPLRADRFSGTALTRVAFAHFGNAKTN